MARSQRPVWLGEDHRGWDHVRVHLALLQDDRLGVYELSAYLGLAAHAETTTGDTFPSVATLAGYAGCSPNRIRTAIDVLERAGYVDIEAAPGAANRYRLLPPPLHVVDPYTPSTPPPRVGDPYTTWGGTPTPRGGEQERDRKLLTTTPLPPVTGGADNAGPSFDALWAAYPRHTDRAAAVKAWAKLKPCDQAAALDGAARYAADPNLPPEQYQPHLTTWLNRRRWEDGPLPPRRDSERNESTFARLARAAERSSR